MDNVERSRVSFSVHDCADATGVATASDHAHISRLKLDGVDDLASVDVQLNRVVNLDHGIRITKSPAVAGVQVGDTLRACLDGTDTAKLVFCLLVGDTVYGEPNGDQGSRHLVNIRA